MVDKANATVFEAVEEGWKGPPFDTFELANILGFSIIPRDSIRDARLLPLANHRYQIEYNPNQSRARIRFSIAHEIAHSFFPDCREQIRNRATKNELSKREWQLEMLCNIGAAELLMPLGSFPEISESDFSIDHLLKLRERFQVSTEAVLLRFMKLSRMACAVFSASNQNQSSNSLLIDYIRASNGWDISIRSGFQIPSESSVYECRAIGYTAKGDEVWDSSVGRIHVESVAVPSYPGADNPRVVGLLCPTKVRKGSVGTIQYLIGDATSPRPDGDKIIAHVVNDATPRWGGGFARVVAKRWQTVQDDFMTWAHQARSNLRLGQHRLFRINAQLSVFSMIAQHGFGESAKPRVRYHALESCLGALSMFANERCATVHMPRIGCGQAGGNWNVVSEMIYDVLCRNGIQVTIYDLPSEKKSMGRTR